MDAVHALNIASDDGHEILFECREAGCGRRLVLKRSGEMIVIDRGDFFARHSGSSEAVEMTSDVLQ